MSKEATKYLRRNSSQWSAAGQFQIFPGGPPAPLATWSETKIPDRIAAILRTQSNRETFAPMSARGSIQNDRGDPCEFTQETLLKVPYFFPDADDDERIGVIVFRNPTCMKSHMGDGAHNVSINQINKELVRQNQFASDVKFRHTESDLFPSSYNSASPDSKQIKGRCFQAINQQGSGILVQYVVRGGSIVAVLHEQYYGSTCMRTAPEVQ